MAKPTTTVATVATTGTPAQPAAATTAVATWQPPAAVTPPKGKLPPTALAGSTKTVPGVVYAMCGPGSQGATLAQLNAAIAALPLAGNHTAQGMLARYANHHGCTITVLGVGGAAVYKLAQPKAQ